jgi:hypothetical protein
VNDYSDAEAHAEALKVKALVEKISAILHRQGPAVQSAVLADLTAMLIAGHFADSPLATTATRAKLLRDHMRLVRDLIKPNEQMILERVKRDSH